MNVQEITKQLYAISKALVEKTGEKPWIAPCVVIEDGKCKIRLTKAYNDIRMLAYEVATAKGDTPEAAIADAFAIIAALPDLATAALRNHMARVADCADKARADGVDEAYIAPLSVVVQQIGSNLLAAPEAV